MRTLDTKLVIKFETAVPYESFKAAVFKSNLPNALRRVEYSEIKWGYIDKEHLVWFDGTFSLENEESDDLSIEMIRLLQVANDVYGARWEWEQIYTHDMAAYFSSDGSDSDSLDNLYLVGTVCETRFAFTDLGTIHAW